MYKIILLSFLLLISHYSFAETILMITDSHGEGRFGTEMVNLAEANGHEISTYSVGGSNPIDWLKGLQGHYGYWEHHTGQPDIRSNKQMTPRLEYLIILHRPESIIVELGTNLWGEFSDDPKAAILKVVTLINQSGAKCYWVGPPDLRINDIRLERFKQLQQMLENDLPSTKCSLFKSWKETKYPATGGDGVHYDGERSELAAKWAQRAYKWFSSH
jgi:hypothetical protein